MFHSVLLCSLLPRYFQLVRTLHSYDLICSVLLYLFLSILVSNLHSFNWICFVSFWPVLFGSCLVLFSSTLLSSAHLKPAQLWSNLVCSILFCFVFFYPTRYCCFPVCYLLFISICTILSWSAWLCSVLFCTASISFTLHNFVLFWSVVLYSSQNGTFLIYLFCHGLYYSAHLYAPLDCCLLHVDWVRLT